ncbi:hypothetical protein BDY24DRAFT_381147 [Mrakia frigida]|uniref:uncharacterized protein n=1 Tax=Mrakia frigida TaxID=29902 RepID=UPI003FCC18F7
MRPSWLRSCMILKLDSLQRRRRNDPFEETRVEASLFRLGSERERERGIQISSPFQFLWTLSRHFLLLKLTISSCLSVHARSSSLLSLLRFVGTSFTFIHNLLFSSVPLHSPQTTSLLAFAPFVLSYPPLRVPFDASSSPPPRYLCLHTPLLLYVPWLLSLSLPSFTLPHFVYFFRSLALKIMTDRFSLSFLPLSFSNPSEVSREQHTRGLDYM